MYSQFDHEDRIREQTNILQRRLSVEDNLITCVVDEVARQACIDSWSDYTFGKINNPFVDTKERYYAILKQRNGGIDEYGLVHTASDIEDHMKLRSIFKTNDQEKKELAKDMINLRAELLRIGIVKTDEPVYFDLLQESIELSRTKEGLSVPLIRYDSVTGKKEVMAYGSVHTAIEIYQRLLQARKDELKTKQQSKDKIDREVKFYESVNNPKFTKPTEEQIRSLPWPCPHCSFRAKTEQELYTHKTGHYATRM